VSNGENIRGKRGGIKKRKDCSEEERTSEGGDIRLQRYLLLTEESPEEISSSEDLITESEKEGSGKTPISDSYPGRRGKQN